MVFFNSSIRSCFWVVDIRLLVWWRSLWDIKIPFEVLIYPKFLEEAPKLSTNFSLIFPRKLALRLCPDLLGFSSLVARSSVSFVRDFLSDISWGFYLFFPCAQ